MKVTRYQPEPPVGPATVEVAEQVLEEPASPPEPHLGESEAENLEVKPIEQADRKPLRGWSINQTSSMLSIEPNPDSADQSTTYYTTLDGPDSEVMILIAVKSKETQSAMEEAKAEVEDAGEVAEEANEAAEAAAVGQSEEVKE